MTMTPSFALRGKKIWVAGHNGMVGTATVRRLQAEDCEVLTVDRAALDLRRQAETEEWIAEHKPDAIVLAAAKVGGIGANASYPAEFIHDNMAIETNVIHGAYKAGVKKLLFLGSSCIYPKHAAQPITEEALLTGALEPTNEWYALAKITGLKMCAAYRRQYGYDFIAAMPCNLYGPGDTYHAENSHVIPALIMKMHGDRTGRVELWGTGSPLREFLYVDDLADALVFMLKNYSAESHLNVGSGAEISIKELAMMIADVIGYDGEIAFDASKPDGTPRKLMDNGKIAALGWNAKIGLREGLALAWRDYLARTEGLSHAAA